MGTILALFPKAQLQAMGFNEGHIKELQRHRVLQECHLSKDGESITAFEADPTVLRLLKTRLKEEKTIDGALDRVRKELGKGQYHGEGRMPPVVGVRDAYD